MKKVAFPFLFFYCVFFFFNAFHFSFLALIVNLGFELDARNKKLRGKKEKASKLEDGITSDSVSDDSDSGRNTNSSQSDSDDDSSSSSEERGVTIEKGVGGEIDDNDILYKPEVNEEEKAKIPTQKSKYGFFCYLCFVLVSFFF